MVREASNPVKTTRRSFAILKLLRKVDGARLTEIAERLGLPDSTVHNHLSTLVEDGFVVKRNGNYHLGLQFLEYGHYVRSRQKVFEIARPELSEIAAKTDEVAALMVEEDGRGIFLDVQKGSKAVPLDLTPGKQVPLHASALGKCILAYAPDEHVDEIIEHHGLEAVTDRTVTDRDELAEQLAFVREHDIAFENEERVIGTRTVATSIKDGSGQIIGAIGVSGPTTRMSQERMNESHPALLSNATNIIELKLEHS